MPHISGFDWKWEKHFILFNSEKKKMGITPPGGGILAKKGIDQF